MPIHVYQCENLCGQRAEIITKTASAPVPVQIRQKCPRCMEATQFHKTVGAPAILTPTTKAVARRNDYRRAKPNAKENVVAGKTADGRSKHELKKKKHSSGGGANQEYQVRRDGSIGGAGIQNGRWKSGALIDHIAQESHTDWGDSYAETYGPSLSEARTEVKEDLKQSGTKLLR